MNPPHSVVDNTRARDPKTFCVVGAGHGGLAMAGHLGLMGHRVHLYNRSPENLNGVRWHGGVEMEGVVTGFGKIELATHKFGAALDGVEIVMVVTPSTAHAGLALSMAPYVRSNMTLILNPGRTGGGLAFRRILLDLGAELPVLGETSTFIYASRALSRHQARIFRIKNGVKLATIPSSDIPGVLEKLRPVFPQFEAGTNIWTTSLENIGAIFHPALTLLNAGWIEGTEGDFDYYSEGITPTIARFLEKLDGERVAVARALGIHTVSAREWLYLTYDAHGGSLHEAIQNTPSYRGIKAPSTLAHRYVTEDVPMSLVPLESLGKHLGVPTPLMTLIIDLAQVTHGTDFRKIGRTIDTLGLTGLDLKGIRALSLDKAVAPKGKKGKRGKSMPSGNGKGKNSQTRKEGTK